MEDLLRIALLERSNFMDEVLLYDLLQFRNNIIIRSEEYGRFNLEDLTANECKLNFRFEREDIPILARALGLPAEIEAPGRYAVSREEGLCICLRRLAYPNRLSDLESLFGLSGPYLSVISNTVISLILNNNKHKLFDLSNNRWLNQDKLRYYSKAIFEKGALIPNCWGFIDGTVRPICKPAVNQQQYFSGHKRTHCVKYQSLLCPDGIIISLHGPYPGRRHDSGIFGDTQLYNQLETSAVFQDEKFVIYGDPAYPIMELLLKPYSTRALTEEQQIFNTRMSAVRQAVEWGFGHVIREFAFLDFKKNQKLYLQDIGAMYLTATILTNCHSCLYGNQTSKYFGTEPPTLQEYLL